MTKEDSGQYFVSKPGRTITQNVTFYISEVFYNSFNLISLSQNDAFGDTFSKTENIKKISRFEEKFLNFFVWMLPLAGLMRTFII